MVERPDVGVRCSLKAMSSEPFRIFDPCHRLQGAALCWPCGRDHAARRERDRCAIGSVAADARQGPEDFNYE